LLRAKLRCIEVEPSNSRPVPLNCFSEQLEAIKKGERVYVLSSLDAKCSQMLKRKELPFVRIEIDDQFGFNFCFGRGGRDCLDLGGGALTSPPAP